MTDLRKAAEMALAALENAPIEYDFHGNPMDAEFCKQSTSAIESLRTALAQDHSFDRTASHMVGEYVDTAEQEPDAWLWLHEGKPVNALMFNPCMKDGHFAKKGFSSTPLFTAPVSKQEPVAWKPVVGYEEFYEVSSVGDLRDIKTKKIKSKSLMGAGYVKADLWANGTRKQTSMHRLVAEAFLISTGNANEVNHKNGIKTDNRVENLEWVTRSDNVNHSYYELNNQVKPISATNIETGNTLYYQSVEAAVRDGFCSAHISSVIAGRRKHHKGFVFKETAPPSKPINFLANGTRYKVTHQGYYGCSIVGLPENLNGQWVALVDATDDKHLQYTAPLSKPWVSLTDEEIWENQGLDDLVWGRNIEAALRSKNA